ncbi:MAG: hypothetical protein HY301_19295 [Verrucomicrobia bacterium]|nr:hypothetical protein [Verrucomicrobiota bacterium]
MMRPAVERAILPPCGTGRATALSCPEISLRRWIIASRTPFMDIKIECQCGQRIAFEVEPMADGRMPVEIECPSCGKDVTAEGDAVLAAKISAAAPPAPVPAEPARPALRLSRPAAPDPAPIPAAAPIPPLAPEPAASASPPRKITKLVGDPHFGRSVLGALIGAALTTAVWFGLWKATGSTWGILALGVGWMTGFFARFIGRSEGPQMALAVAGVALLFIFGFQFYRAHAELAGWRSDDATIEKNYQEQLAHARKLVEGVPNGSDEEIREWMVKDARADGEKLRAADITADEIKVFQDFELKAARELAGGKQSKEDFRARVRQNEDLAINSVFGRIYFWVRAIGIFSIVFIIGGTGLAYRFGNGEG